jgi:hypothetical protein
MSPLEVGTLNDTTKHKILIQAGGIYGYENYDGNGNEIRRFTLSPGSGTLSLYETGTGTLRQTINGNGVLWQYDANGNIRTYIEYGDIYLRDAAGNNRHHLDSEGKLTQYDSNGKKRTYLEYGDVFLYTSAEKQTVKLSGAAFPTIGGSLQLYDPNANERARLHADGLRFYNASGTQTGNYPNNVNLSELVYLQTYNFNGVSISAGTSGTRAAQRSQSVYKSGYRPIVARLSYVSDSSLANVVPFFGLGDESGLYVNFYRASGGSGTINATVIVAFIRTEVTGVSW